jgi:c-di-GMP phosphodiesterase Gmr
MQSSEQLHETLVSLSRENERLRTEAMHANLLLRALESLLRIGADDDPFGNVFDSLKTVFPFDKAMVLAESGDNSLICIAALPHALIGMRWTVGSFFRRVLDGRVSVTFSNHDLEEWRDIPDEHLSPAEPALYLPIRVRERRGLLMLLRSAGGAGFDRAHAALARKFAMLASHALAARNASQSEAESQNLRALTEQLHRSKQYAQRNADLLNEIVSLLPISLTVQDDTGRFVLVNDVAATYMGQPAKDLIGVSPFDANPEPQAAERWQHALQEVGAGQAVATDQKRVTAQGERTFLTWCKPVRIFDETLLLSTSLDITERKVFEEQLALRAYFDELTGLPNRAFIQDRVELLMDAGEPLPRFALAFIDIDNFKHINDYYSHATGDQVLVTIAHRISARVRETDLLARISGDEFMLLINPLTDDDTLQATVQGILDDLRQPFAVDGVQCFTSASIGISIFPDHGTTYEALRRNADTAMYRAKTGAKGQATLFDAGMGQAVAQRMEIEQRLRLGIRDRRFCCAFQPKVDIRHQRVVGFEALVRWRDEFGVIQAPGAFVGIATELGLLDQITHYVLADAIEALEPLDRRFGSDTTISINVAAKQAGDLQFMRLFAEAIAATGRAGRFMLEVTEDAFVETNLFQTEVLPILRDAGVRVSIDDFGTGYSSLSALSDITADEIKVDRSFITAIHQRPRSQSVLKAIESLSRALDMTVVAEGVETLDELLYLQAATGIRYAQGYHFAKPMFLDDLVKATIIPDADAVGAEPARLSSRVA